MKKIIAPVILLLLATNFACAQVVFELSEEEKKANKKNPGFKFYTALNFVSPQEVNQWIDNYIEEKYGPTYYLLGSSYISIGGTIGFMIGIPVHEQIKPQIVLEYTGASKTVEIDSDTERFAINCFSGGGVVDYYFKSNTNQTFFVGTGILYSSSNFRDYKAQGISAKFHIGYSLSLPSIALEFFVGGDIRPKKVSNADDQIQNINLSAPAFGVRIGF